MSVINRIKLSNACNQDCIFCSGFSEKKFRLSSARAIDMIRNKQGAGVVNFTGGEPSIDTRFPFYVREAEKCKYNKIVVLTNGVKFSSLPFAKKMKVCGLTHAVVSFYHTNEVVHDNLSSRQRSLSRKLQGIKNLRSCGIDVTINIVIFSFNSHLLTSMVEILSRHLGIKSFVFSFCEPNCQRVRQKPYLKPDILSSLKMLKMTHSLCRKRKIAFRIPQSGALPSCVFKALRIPVSPLDIIHGTDFDNVGRSFFARCKSCREREACQGVINDYKEQVGQIIGFK